MKNAYKLSDSSNKKLKIFKQTGWVTDIDIAPCDGFVVSRGGGQCKNHARWHFESPVKNSYGESTTTGNYCWMHLDTRGLFGSNVDFDNTIEWMIEHGYMARRTFGDGQERAFWTDVSAYNLELTDKIGFTKLLVRLYVAPPGSRRNKIIVLLENAFKHNEFARQFSQADCLASICVECLELITYVDHPTSGGWWSHYTHPDDHHDAESLLRIETEEDVFGAETRVWPKNTQDSFTKLVNRDMIHNDKDTSSN